MTDDERLSQELAQLGKRIAAGSSIVDGVMRHIETVATPSSRPNAGNRTARSSAMLIVPAIVLFVGLLAVMRSSNPDPAPIVVQNPAGPADPVPADGLGAVPIENTDRRENPSRGVPALPPATPAASVPAGLPKARPGVDALKKPSRVSPATRPSKVATGVASLMKTPPFAAVWVNSWGMRTGEPFLRVAVWDDGRILFRENPCTDTRKFRLGRLASKQILMLKQRLAKTGIFELKGRKSWLVPDAPVMYTRVSIGKKRQVLSWDEREMKGYGIGISPGAQAKQFIKTWHSVTRVLLSALPDEHTRVDAKNIKIPKSWSD